MKRKSITLIVAIVLVFTCTLGATIAWLTAKTDEVKNTFTAGNIDITLTETKPSGQTAKMVPGNTIEKNPTVSVVDSSENCYLFVKIEKSSSLDTYIGYTVADGWTALDGVSGVYYRTVLASDTVKTFSVIQGDQVTVKDTVTKADMEALSAQQAIQPTLNFTAYAVQKENIATPAEAWAKFA